MTNLKNDVKHVTAKVVTVEHALFLARWLVSRSAWFDFMPLPDDRYEFAFRPEHEPAVRKLIAQLRLDKHGLFDQSLRGERINFWQKDRAPDLEGNDTGDVISGYAEFDENGIMIYVDGYGNATGKPWAVAALEYHGGDLKMLLWANYAKEDPDVHLLNNAKEPASDATVDS